ncbi:DMT family transporter [Hyphomicrobium facile]|uniref:EamA domain-containing membrane protein RarD n=1 Tax=Hyphomicrobium facile TaxID=51670 RepID=A0A1I7NDV4_9HYPH|nr:EamA domain-containing membrane protein RarD [Hyphomicrobium facile]
MTMEQADFWGTRRMGVALVTASAVCWSTAGLFVRLANLDIATLVVWYAMSACLGLGVVCAVRLRGGLWRAILGIGWPGLVYVIIAAFCATSYVLALQYTSVANVMTIYASLPLVATAIAFLWLNERVSRQFIVAGIIAMAGIAITAGAAATINDAIGLIVSFLMTVAFAVMLVVSKRYANLDVLLASAIAAGLAAAVCAPFMNYGVPSLIQLSGCVLYGLLAYGLGINLALVGGRMIKSGEAGLLTMLEIVLGPIWVWLFFGEEPTIEAVVGAATALGAVTWYLSIERQPLPEPAPS